MKTMAKVVKAFNVKTVIYGDYERYKVFEQPVNIPNNRGKTGIRGHAENKEESIRKSIQRARDKIFGYILANEWTYWATQTFSADVLDRYNLDEIVRKYNRRLLYLKKKYDGLKWLIVPEQHKDGAYHLHMFCYGIPQDRVKYSGYTYFNKEKQISRKVYNWIDTVDFGFNDYIYIGDCDPLERLKMAKYVTKYITKDLAEKRFNKKMYWVSKGLKLPTVYTSLATNINDIISQNALIITNNCYYIQNKDTGEVFGKVYDIFAYNPYPF